MKNIKDKHSSPADRRKYIRLDHIFPVEFRFLGVGGEPVSGWYQGFTQDVSCGGLCLTVNNLEFGDVKYLADKDIVLALNINIPLGKDAVKASAKLAWFQTARTEPVLQYVLGICYDSIDQNESRRIMKYATTRKFFKAMAITFTIFLSVGLVLAGFNNARLHIENEKLVAGLSVNLSHQKALRHGSESLKAQIEDMKFLLSQSDRKIDTLQRMLSDASSGDKKTITALQGSIDFLKKYQEKLKSDITGLVERKDKVEDDAAAKAQEASLLEKKIRDKLYAWLAAHQNINTGLVASFEGDVDMNDWGFTYDEALASIAFVKNGDFDKARKILEFYSKAVKSDSGGFFNAYYASTGEVSEYVAHVGPNIWLGLAVLQYTKHANDKRYLKMAEEISLWLDTARDAEGGLMGGREFSWYSTEHNLDAYAFYKMLFELTGDKEYGHRSEQALQWLNKNAYSRISSPIVKRGKGDSTIATDTYAWSITAVSPETLKEVGMDPDEIIEFALANCCVLVDHRKPDGTFARVKGFDFAKHKNLARGGVISCEWTAQMILALKIMADYYSDLGNSDKSKYYGSLAYEYTSELSKMIITSPSPVGQGDFCLPYASQEFADTGHGWRTPKGDRTGSVAATAYAILAIDNFNPLRFNPTEHVAF